MPGPAKNPTTPKQHGAEHGASGGDKIPNVPVLIAAIETDGGEQVSSVAENVLQTLSLPANSFKRILIEATVRERYEVDASNKTNNTWNIDVDGSTVKTFTSRIIALATASADSGNRHTFNISTIVNGGQAAAVDVDITGQMTINNANCGVMVYNMRLWGLG
jgi:hypothetical protein